MVWLLCVLCMQYNYLYADLKRTYSVSKETIIQEVIECPIFQIIYVLTTYVILSSRFPIGYIYMYVQLSQKMSACDERSEALGQDFVDGQKTMQAFLQVILYIYICIHIKLT
jgi:predicted membrane protein